MAEKFLSTDSNIIPINIPYVNQIFHNQSIWKWIIKTIYVAPYILKDAHVQFKSSENHYHQFWTQLKQC